MTSANENQSTNEDTSQTNLQKELKKCKESRRTIETEYLKCEKELRRKTEEVEIVKIEINDLKKIKELKDVMQDKTN